MALDHAGKLTSLISGNGLRALFGAADTGRSNPAQNQQYDEDDHDYPDDTDPTVTEAVAVTAEAAAEATKQKDDEYDDEYKSERHGLTPLVDPDDPGSPMSSLILTLPLREMPYYFVSDEGRARSVLQVANVREVPISAENSFWLCEQY
jgi:hypothetical protein